MKEDDLEFHLEAPNDLPKLNKKCSKIEKIILILLISIIILLICLTILCIIKVINIKNDDNNESNPQDPWDEEEKITENHIKNNLERIMQDEKLPFKESYNEKRSNISYANINNIIINTFKKGGKNFIEEIGNINEGFDYEKNELNIYDLYIPYSATKRKDKYNKIILFIHGGSWIGGKKENMNYLCKYYLKYEFITATMEFNPLKRKSINHSVFRILDEISATILSIKNYLKNEGFNENKLEMAIGGGSSGGHLSLLYAYYFKENPIPIKFVINICGPVTLELEYWFQINNFNETLENIDQNSINKIRNGKKNQKS